MRLWLLPVFLLFVSLAPAFADGFPECFDHGNGGGAPAGAPTRYRIVGGEHPYLVPMNADGPGREKVFRLLIENVRFTNYKCWGKDKSLTGFDIEMMTQAAAEAGYQSIEFVLRPWVDVEYQGKKRVSLLVDLINGMGDAVSAGMSITPERREIVDMVGPIYKAGKKLMARKDNPKIDERRLAELRSVPGDGYEALRGLSAVVAAGDIRADYFRRLQAAFPGLVKYLRLEGDKVVSDPEEADRFSVLEVKDFSLINDFVDHHMQPDIFGRRFDLVMLDTGSSKSFLEEGKLGSDTQIVTGNLATDPVLGSVFGLGDGVSFRKGSRLEANFRSVLAGMVRSGRIDQLVEKWFGDENAADHGWAQPQAR